MKKNNYEVSFKDIESYISSEPEVLKKFLKIFLETSREELSLLNTALYQKNLKNIEQIAYSLKSTYGYFTGSGISEVMDLISKNSKVDQDINFATKLLESIEQQLKQIDLQVSKYINSQLSFYEKYLKPNKHRQRLSLLSGR